MRSITRSTLIVAALFAAIFAVHRTVLSHCEIPCGIYGDKTRVDLLYEHVATIEKSMSQISQLQKESPVNYNQLVRWIANKDQHAEELQHMVRQYFMTQRVKPKPAGDPGHAKYITQLTALHGMLVSSMKAKQTLDPVHCGALREQIDRFAAAYFSEEDLKHIREHHGKHSEDK
jgi:nickel superoxide dismutase